MSTNFPGVFDSYTTKTDNVDTVSAAHINNLQDAVVALEGQFSVNGNVGLAEGRLSLSSSDPAPTADQTAKTTVYYLPYVGNRIAVYNTTTTGWDVLSFGSASVSVPATTSTNFDIFAYNNSGTLTLQTVNWTNDTTRATAITRQDGIYCKSGDLGKRYLGTGRTTTSSGQCEDSRTNRFVWNYYNRLHKRFYKADATSHTYGSGTWRYWNNSFMGCYFVVGLVDEAVTVGWSARVDGSVGYPWCGLGLNGATPIIGDGGVPMVAGANYLSSGGPIGAAVVLEPRTGLNSISISESDAGAGAFGNPTFDWAWLVGSVRG